MRSALRAGLYGHGRMNVLLGRCMCQPDPVWECSGRDDASRAIGGPRWERALGQEAGGLESRFGVWPARDARESTEPTGPTGSMLIRRGALYWLF